jgi:hypothetical protein
MAIIALRALRATMQALRTGYEDQEIGYQRLIDELHNRSQKLAEDESGEYARHWLQGRGLGKGAKLAGQEFWEFMSGPVHANARAVLDWIVISQENGSTQIVVDPKRRPDVANLCLSSWPARAETSPTSSRSKTDRLAISQSSTPISTRHPRSGFLKTRTRDPLVRLPWRHPE